MAEHITEQLRRWKERWPDPAWIGFLLYLEMREYLLARGWVVNRVDVWSHPEFPGYSGDIMAVMARETAAVKGTSPDPNVCTVTIPAAQFRLVPGGERLLAVLMDLDEADADRLVNGG